MTKKEARQILTMGNHKLGKNIATFDLPASLEVCGRVCPGCYAEKAQRVYPGVLPSRARKLAFSKTLAFESVMVKAIETLKPEYVRIHSSGEMYSQVYIDKWVMIAKRLPNTGFYTYTKQFSKFDFRALKALDNVVVIDSLHNGMMNYGPLDKVGDGMFICPDHGGSAERTMFPEGPICGVTCTYCMSKTAQDSGVYFKAH